MFRAHKPRRIFFALLFILISHSSAWAQTDQAFDEYGVGPRDAAMGNAYTGVADDFASAYYNPAGTSQAPDTNITFGYKFLSPKVYAKFPGFDKYKFTKYPGTGWGLFGFTTDFHMPKYIDPKYTDRFSFAVAIALSNFVHSYTNYSEQYTPYYFRYQDRPVALLSVYTSFAVKITDWAAVGGGIVLAPSVTYADTRVRTDIYLPEGNSDTKQGIVNRSYGIVEPVLGVLFRVPIAGLPDRLRVGLTWRDEVKVIDGDGVALNRNILHVKGTDQTLEPVPPMKVPVKTMSGYSPMQAVLGLSFQPGGGTLIAADTIWKNWSRWVNYFYHRPSPNFRDTWQERLGFEKKFFSDARWLGFWALRAGWYYEPSPTPSQNNEWNILDNDKHVFTGGCGIQFDDVLGIIHTPINLDANFQAHDLVERTLSNGHDPAYPRIQTGGMVYSGTVAATLTW